MSGNFSSGRRAVVRAQSKPALNQQKRRKGAGNEQQVIEPAMKENDMTMRLDQPSIRRIKQATNQTEGIKDITKSPHSSARMTRPKPNPSRTFNKRTFEKITAIKYIQPANCPDRPQNKHCFRTRVFTRWRGWQSKRWVGIWKRFSSRARRRVRAS